MNKPPDDSMRDARPYLFGGRQFLLTHYDFPAAPSFLIKRMPFGNKLDRMNVHSGVELGVCVEGTCRLFYNGEWHAMGKGDAYFIDSTKPHGHEADTAVAANVFAHFKPQAIQGLCPAECQLWLLQPFALVVSGKMPPVAPAGDARAIGRNLESALEIYDARDPFKYLAAWSLVVPVFLELRNYANRRMPIPVESLFLRNHDSIQRALDFIGEHFTEPISMTDIARRSALSPSRLSHIFPEVMHVSPIGYRNRMRMQLAISLLTSSSENLETIATRCGYNSSRLFKRMLAAYTKGNPFEFRRKVEKTPSTMPVDGPTPPHPAA